MGPLLAVPLFEAGHYETCLFAVASGALSMAAIVLAERLRRGAFWWEEGGGGGWEVPSDEERHKLTSE